MMLWHTIIYGYQAALLTQEAKQPAVALCMRVSTVIPLIGAGRLHEAEQLIQQSLLQETPSGSPRLPEVGWIMILQAEILRECNDLASARALATEAIALCEQSVALASLPFLISGVRRADTRLPLLWRCGRRRHISPAG